MLLCLTLTRKGVSAWARHVQSSHPGKHWEGGTKLKVAAVQGDQGGCMGLGRSIPTHARDPASGAKWVGRLATSEVVHHGLLRRRRKHPPTA